MRTLYTHLDAALYLVAALKRKQNPVAVGAEPLTPPALLAPHAGSPPLGLLRRRALTLGD
jgi:hypothetical protein